MSGSVYPCQRCGTNRWTNEEIPCPKCGKTRTKAEQAKDIERLQLRLFEAVKRPRKRWFRIYQEAILQNQIERFEAWQKSEVL